VSRPSFFLLPNATASPRRATRGAFLCAVERYQVGLGGASARPKFSPIAVLNEKLPQSVRLGPAIALPIRNGYP
jgi:hypothetical protein